VRSRTVRWFDALRGPEAGTRSGLLAVAIAVAATGGVFALTAPTADAHRARYTGKVTIERNPDLHGRVSSNRAGCTKRRMVEILHRGLNGAPGGRLTTVRTGTTGRWQYLSPSLNGDFYAVIKPKTVRSARHRHICAGARSASVRLGQF
jgi:hypothetical protein